MGTPDFAVGSLKALVENGQRIVGIVTAEDKASGRGQKMQSPPVRQYAEKAGIDAILQPARLKDPVFLEELRKLRADLFVVVAFRMLPEEVWSMPPRGTVNLHASLLPDYRGAAPINRVIMNGEKETGVTTFFIEKDIDTGNILLAEKYPIGPDTTAGELHDGLMDTGARLLVKTIRAIAENDIHPIPQNELSRGGKLHTAPKIFREDCTIDWNKTALEVHNHIRGLSPYPAAWTAFRINGENVQCKIYRSKIEQVNSGISPGTIITDGKKTLKVAVKDGFIHIMSIQQASKKRMEADEFLRGINSIETTQI